jgi:hypothetical protein
MYFVLFQSSKNNQWYWSLKDNNHPTIAAGVQGVTDRMQERECWRKPPDWPKVKNCQTLPQDDRNVKYGFLFYAASQS